MSSPSLPVQGPPGLPTTIAPDAASSEDAVAFIAELAADVGALTLAASRGGPPPEVLEQIAAAGVLAERMREGGHQLRFLDAGSYERTRIEVQDARGVAMRVLTATEAAELAVSGSLRS